MLVPVLEIPFMCSICGLEFENKIQITDHITMHKDDQVNYRRVDLLESVENSFCNNTAFNKNNGMVPKIDIIPLVSTESTPIISTKNAVNTAEIKLKENECLECGKKFSSSYGLKRHKLHHADVKPFTCKVCGKGFTERSKLKRHLYIHAGIRPFECSTCGSTFTEKNRLTHHMATHSEQKHFKCSECEKLFSTEYSLKRHKIIHEDNRKVQSQHFKCSECEKLFSTEYSLKRHKIIHEDNRKVQSQLLNNKSITIQTL
ncbi:unnamed protein product [Meganyctiphanes norvegica]|uniref:C2H2-type domain-containing protein n=1 Tax=Meganyctiphanes norvegica TaxID=48144 RepID=A0AAV2SIK0_MEGNR